MKIGIVPSTMLTTMLTTSDLRASTYVAPFRNNDIAIKRNLKVLKEAKARLNRLQRERKAIRDKTAGIEFLAK